MIPSALAFVYSPVDRGLLGDHGLVQSQNFEHVLPLLDVDEPLQLIHLPSCNGQTRSMIDKWAEWTWAEGLQSPSESLEHSKQPMRSHAHAEVLSHASSTCSNSQSVTTRNQGDIRHVVSSEQDMQSNRLAGLHVPCCFDGERS